VLNVVNLAARGTQAHSEGPENISKIVVARDGIEPPTPAFSGLADAGFPVKRRETREQQVTPRRGE